MAEKQHILICGERGVGKSTLIDRLLETCPRPRYGFITKMGPTGADGFRSVYIHPAGQPIADRVYTDANCVGACDSRAHRPHPDVFDTLGVRYIQEARPGGIIVMDELGFLEAEANGFTAAVLLALSEDIPVIAAVKRRADVAFLNEVRSTPRGEVFYIDPENRDDLYLQLLPRIRCL